MSALPPRNKDHSKCRFSTSHSVGSSQNRLCSANDNDANESEDGERQQFILDEPHVERLQSMSTASSVDVTLTELSAIAFPDPSLG